MGSGDEMIFPGDMKGSCNIVSFIQSVEGNTYGSIYEYWYFNIEGKMKVKLMLKLLFP